MKIDTLTNTFIILDCIGMAFCSYQPTGYFELQKKQDLCIMWYRQRHTQVLQVWDLDYDRKRTRRTNARTHDRGRARNILEGKTR